MSIIADTYYVIIWLYSAVSSTLFNGKDSLGTPCNSECLWINSSWELNHFCHLPGISSLFLWTESNNLFRELEIRLKVEITLRSRVNMEIEIFYVKKFSTYDKRSVISLEENLIVFKSFHVNISMKVFGILIRIPRGFSEIKQNRDLPLRFGI